jgi:hypothetical protein
VNQKQKAAIESAAEAIASVEDVESADICGHVAELAFKLFSWVNESDLDPTWVRGIGGTHDWIRVGNHNVDFSAVQYEKPYPFVTKVGSRQAMAFYRDFPEETSTEEPESFFPLVEDVAGGECEGPEGMLLRKALEVFSAQMERRGFLTPAL